MSHNRAVTAANRERRAHRMELAIDQARDRVTLLQLQLRKLTPLSTLSKSLSQGSITPEQFVSRLMYSGFTADEAIMQFEETKNVIPNNDIPHLPNGYSPETTLHWKDRLHMPLRASTRRPRLDAPAHNGTSSDTGMSQ